MLARDFNIMELPHKLHIREIIQTFESIVDEVLQQADM